MRILFVGAEAVPFVSTGGLGDVLGSLPGALAAADPSLDVRVVIPLYGQIAARWREKMQEEAILTVSLAWRQQYCGVYSLRRGGVTWYFIDNEYYFKRDAVYGSFDEGERYAFFCRAVLEILPRINFFPDVLHAHDWQAALSLIYLSTLYRDVPAYRDIRRVFTIHNIEYQGKFDCAILGDVFGLSDGVLPLLRHDNCLNLMKAAIECADRVTTVSPRYAEELLTEAYAQGLAVCLNANRGKLSGILNGIDTVGYNPAADPDIVCPYSADRPAGKKRNKAALRQELGLPERDVPLFAIVSRLVGQKGIDIMVEALPVLLSENDMQLVVLGTGAAFYEEQFRQLENRFPDRVRVRLTYDRPLAKRFYAGCDLFLMPSRTEPCGLAQMIALRYGAVPITRETGGLYDSVRYYQRLEDGTIIGNGFTFADYTPTALANCIRSALAVWWDRPMWSALVRHDMQEDFSWNVAAEKYLALYR